MISRRIRTRHIHAKMSASEKILFSDKISFTKDALSLNTFLGKDLRLILQSSNSLYKSNRKLQLTRNKASCIKKISSFSIFQNLSQTHTMWNDKTKERGKLSFFHTVKYDDNHPCTLISHLEKEWRQSVAKTVSDFHINHV